MTILLLRHATRSIIEFGDPQLNETGLAQARALAADRALPAPTRLICSPKTRARQTLTPLAERTHLDLDVDANLDERNENEDAREFSRRIDACLAKLAALDSTEVVYVCSHLDWLEEALPRVATVSFTESSWAPGEYRNFTVEAGVWKLTGRGCAGR